MRFLSATLLSITLVVLTYGQTFRNGRNEAPRIAAQHASLRPSSTQIKRAVMIQGTRHATNRHRADSRQRVSRRGSGADAVIPHGAFARTPSRYDQNGSPSTRFALR